ncbi:MAG: hypothetical protein ACLR23_19550 [Clostridia bacterium]
MLIVPKSKWAVILAALFETLLLCVSCSSGECGSQGSGSLNPTGAESSQPSPDYSDKTKLVYLVPEGYKHGEKTVNAINEYLDGEGAPYYIEFQGLPDSDTSAYETVVKAHVKSADLLFTGRSGTGYVELTGRTHCYVWTSIWPQRKGGACMSPFPRITGMR